MIFAANSSPSRSTRVLAAESPTCCTYQCRASAGTRVGTCKSRSSSPSSISMNIPGTEHSAFAVCINHDGDPASLEIGKIYEILVDESAEYHGYFRVIDESGQDCAYWKDRFLPLSIPEVLQKALFRAV